MNTAKTSFTIKLAAFFLITMLFFTFCSKSIVYIFTPKVTAELAQSGYIETSYDFSSIEFIYDSIKSIKIPEKLAESMTILAIGFKVGDEVKKGDTLIVFDTSNIEKNMESIKEQIASIEIDIQEFDKNYEKITQELQAEIKDLDFKINTGHELLPKKELEALMEQRQKKQVELQYIKDTGIINGEKRTVLEQKSESCKKELASLYEIVSKHSRITADEPGIVSKIYVTEGASYGGVTPLMDISVDGGKKSIVIKTDKLDEAKIQKGTRCIVREKSAVQSGIVEEIRFLDGYYLVTVSIPDEIKLLLNNPSDISVSFSFKSQLYSEIIPNSAFYQEGKIYLLKEKDGFWGKEYYAVSVDVSTGESNDHFTAVTHGLMRGDVIITGWDRQIYNNARVMVPLK